MDKAAIKAAVQKRHSYIANNLESLSLKRCRQLIAQDLGLPENGLDGEKKYVLGLIDEIVTRAANAADPTPRSREAAPAVKRKKDQNNEGKKRPRTGVMKSSSAHTATSYGATVDKLKGVCKAASITVAPTVYTRVSSAQDVEDRLRALLAKHGLSEGSLAGDIARVRKRLAKERDLEGIDISNIVEAGRRSRAHGPNLQSRSQSSKGGVDTRSEEEDHDGNENARPSNICSKGRPDVKGTQEGPVEAMDKDRSSSDARGGVSGDMDMAAQQQAPAGGEQKDEAAIANPEEAGPGEKGKRRIAAWSDDDE